jgi:hypothetical protein
MPVSERQIAANYANDAFLNQFIADEQPVAKLKSSWSSKCRTDLAGQTRAAHAGQLFCPAAENSGAGQEWRNTHRNRLRTRPLHPCSRRAWIAPINPPPPNSRNARKNGV